MKNVNNEGDATGLEVVCAWCGGVIRRAANKASQGMCQTCFERLMRNHIRASQPASVRRYASER